MRGLLNYRAEFHKAGLTNGFQWLDGSFCEDIETIESRKPRDVDVVTFFSIPPGVSQANLAPVVSLLQDVPHCKQNYSVDGYIMPLGGALTASTVRLISYWSSMWSHRRNGLWKGFVQVDLAPTKDAEAEQVLNQKQVTVP